MKGTFLSGRLLSKLLQKRGMTGRLRGLAEAKRGVSPRIGMLSKLDLEVRPGEVLQMRKGKFFQQLTCRTNLLLIHIGFPGDARVCSSFAGRKHMMVATQGLSCQVAESPMLRSK